MVNERVIVKGLLCLRHGRSWLLISSYVNLKRISDMNDYKGYSSPDLRVQKAITFIQSNLARDISVTEIAEAVQLSPSRLRYLFKAEMGISLVRYRRRLRLECARKLLETELWSVKQVMTAVGFNDLSHFSNDFKQAYSHSPGQYRIVQGRCKNGDGE